MKKRSLLHRDFLPFFGSPLQNRLNVMDLIPFFIPATVCLMERYVGLSSYEMLTSSKLHKWSICNSSFISSLRRQQASVCMAHPSPVSVNHIVTDREELPIILSGKSLSVLRTVIHCSIISKLSYLMKYWSEMSRSYHFTNSFPSQQYQALLPLQSLLGLPHIIVSLWEAGVNWWVWSFSPGKKTYFPLKANYNCRCWICR